MKQSENNRTRAQRGALALLCATDGLIDQQYLGLAVRNLITNLGHYCDTQGLQFRRINKGAVRDWEEQRQADQ